MKGDVQMHDYAAALFEPRLSLSPAEWCQANLFLSADETDEPGPLSFAQTPYDEEILNCYGDDRITDLAVVATPQSGKTLVTLCGVSWMISHQPTPVLWVLPNRELAKALSEGRWQKMIEANPCLEKLKPGNADAFKNMEQEMDGSTVTFANALSIANLSSRPKRVVIQDEVDKFIAPSKRESHSSLQADKRTQKQNNPKRIKVSSPSIPEGVIWQEFLKGDRREWYVPCPACGTFFLPEVEHVRWDPAAKKKSGEWDHAIVAHTAHLVTPCCQGRVTEDMRTRMMRAGKWVPTNPGGCLPGYRSYRRPLIITPWRSGEFRSIAVAFLEAKRTWNLHDFRNSVEARPYKPEVKITDAETLQARAETYEAGIPRGVLALTVGADLQDDRIELEIIGWGLGLENWSIEYQIFYGDPADPAVFGEVEKYLLERRELEIACACFDSGGHKTQSVYNFTRPREGRRWFSIRGSSVVGKPIAGRPSKMPQGGRLFVVGTEAAKGLIHSHFKVTKPGPGYCHFRDDYDREYFEQLCAEEMRTRFVKGFPTQEWFKIRDRNEALDVRVYNYAALHILGGERYLAKLARHRQREVAAEAAVPGEAPLPAPDLPRPKVRKGPVFRVGGFGPHW